jgi:tetratricopeptide (TPR) repeat protein
MVSVWALTLIVLMTAGCRKPAPEPEIATEQDLRELHTEIGALLDSGQTNAALERLSTQLDVPSWSSFRGVLFRNLLGVLLQAGRYTEAENRLLDVASDEDMARDGLGLIHSHYVRSGREGLSAWTERTLSSGFPESLQPTLLLWHGQALFKGGGFDKLIETWVPMVQEQTNTESARRILAGMLRYLLHSSALAQTESLARRIEELYPGEAKIASLVAIVRAEIFAARNEGEILDAHIRTVAARLQDSDLQRCLRIARRASAGDMAVDRLDKLYRFVLDTQKGKTNSISFAAQQWVQSAVDGKNVPAILERFGTALECKIKPSRLLRILRNAAYVVLEKGSTENKSHLLRMADTVRSSLETDAERSEITLLHLDAAFLEKDYKRAITLIEAGIPEKDEAWHSMALCKLRAHLALKNGDTREAVRHFREFMKSVEKWDQPEQDPTTGIKYTQDMTLGFNAKRIGDLLSSISDTEGASEAYREARSYYETAAKELRKDSPEYELVQKELAEIPADKP